jgi:hypothetical protein
MYEKPLVGRVALGAAGKYNPVSDHEVNVGRVLFDRGSVGVDFKAARTADVEPAPSLTGGRGRVLVAGQGSHLERPLARLIPDSCLRSVESGNGSRWD